MKQHLGLCVIALHPITMHPRHVMEKLGITYQVSTPQSLMDQWWFWNCENVPDPLPTYLRILKRTPDEAVGWGLSQECADLINKEAE